MPVLSEYIKLRTEQNRELSWGELDDNFLYVANPWVTYRHYKEGSIVYYDAGITGSSGLSWYRATVDNGPSVVFNIGEWEPVGASSAGSGSILVQNGLSTNTVSVLDFASSDFNISVVGSTATITLDGSAIKYWLESGDPGIGTGQNAAAVIHTGNVVIGAGSFGANKLAVNGNTIITGDLVVNGTVNTVDVLQLATEYAAHTHTALPTTFTNYSSLFPNSIGQLEDFNIDTSTLVNGQVLSWDNSGQKWVNTTAAASSLQTLSDVQFGFSLAANQILQYNATSGKWTNRNVGTNGDTGLIMPGFGHNHDTRYYTKTQLGTVSSSFINWNNLSSLPADNTEYVIIGAMDSPFASNYARTLGSSDGSINIDTTTNNILDLTVASVIGLEVDQDGTGVTTGSTILDFVTNSYGGFTITSVTGGVAQIELDTPTIQVVTDVVGAIDTSHLYLGDPDGSGCDTADRNVFFSDSIAPSAGTGQYNVYGVAKQWVGKESISSTVTFNSLQPRLVFVDTANLTWSVTEDIGNGYHLVEASPNLNSTIGVSVDTSFIGDASDIEFISGNGATISGNVLSGSALEVTVDVSAGLDIICSNDNTTTSPIKITGTGGYFELSGGGNFIEIDSPADIGGETGGIILKSPNGNRWLVTVDNSGGLVTNAL
jgi:hypothetical protein